MKRLILVPLVSALVGAGIVVGVLAAAGNLKGSSKERVVTTEVQDTSPATSSNTSSSTSNVSSGLNAHEIYERDAPAVAYVQSTIEKKASASEDPFDYGEEDEKEESGTATGSGILISNTEGLILTNWHVVEEASKVEVKFGEHATFVEATVVGHNPSQDLALLRVPKSDVEKIKPLTLGDSSTVQVGESVLAIGNPFDLTRTLTTGIVSALDRQITAPNGFQIENVIQTDAPINPGNSGGPLLNGNGEVIGINSQIETGGSDDDGNIGIGFAVPINTAKKELPELKEGGTIKTAYLGVEAMSVTSDLNALNLPVKEGAMVVKVESGEPAAKAGIKEGDLTVETTEGTVKAGGTIIVGLDGKKVKNAEDLTAYIEEEKPGDKIKLEVEQPNGSGKYEAKTIEVTLGERPKSIENPDTPSR